MTHHRLCFLRYLLFLRPCRQPKTRGLRSYGNTGGKSTAGGQCKGGHEAGGIALLCAVQFVAVAVFIRKFDNDGQVRNLSYGLFIRPCRKPKRADCASMEIPAANRRLVVSAKAATRPEELRFYVLSDSSPSIPLFEKSTMTDRLETYPTTN